MPKRNEKIIISDIVEHIEFILKITNEMNQIEYLNDRIKSYAVDRSFEIIGEATKQLPMDFTLKYPDIEWHKMISFRNLLIHEYFRVERRIQWNIIKNILPDLKINLDKLIEAL